MTTPLISVIVVFHNMAREAPRTLATLSSAYQREIASDQVEIIAVDNGSSVPLAREMVEAFGPQFRLLKFESTTPSPAAAINAGVQVSRGELVTICIDGARMLSPRVLAFTAAAFRAWRNPLVATLSWHLGPDLQNVSMLSGYDQVIEDGLLAGIDWMSDGYSLFSISSLAASSSRGWLLTPAESNCLTMRRSLFDAIGGVDERFVSKGGGLVGHDLFARALQRAERFIVLLGEGTFHQFHGGVATNVPLDRHPGAVFADEYVSIRGREYEVPRVAPTLVGEVSASALPFIQVSVQRWMESMNAPSQ